MYIKFVYYLCIFATKATRINCALYSHILRFVPYSVSRWSWTYVTIFLFVILITILFTVHFQAVVFKEPTDLIEN